MPRVKRTPDVPTDRLDGMLARLKLSGIRDQLDNQSCAIFGALENRSRRSPSSPRYSGRHAGGPPPQPSGIALGRSAEQAGVLAAELLRA
jgi:hypothetical protein